MKYLLFILLLISGVATAQTTYYIRADSTKLQKIGGNNELILQNSTRTRTGAYLKNISNGITGFFYAVDSAYISGSNLVLVRGGGTQNITVSSGVGGYNSNVGSGYRWVIPNTNNIKTLLAGTNITIDSSVANTLTINASTAAATVPISGLTASAATNGLTIGHAQTWTSSLTTATPLTLTTSTMTTGNLLSLVSTSTALSGGNEGLNISMTGVNANAITGVVGATVTVGNTGTASTNIGVQSNITGGSSTNSGFYSVVDGTGGTLNYGYNSDVTSSGGNNYGGSFSAAGATNNTGVYGSAGGAHTTNIGGQFVAAAAANNYSIQLGGASTQSGNIRFMGTTSGAVLMKVADAAGTWTMTLPTNDGGSGEFLQTDGAGVTSWAASSGGGTPAGNFGNLQINRNGAFATPGSDSLDFDGGLVVKGNVMLTTTGGNNNGFKITSNSDYAVYQAENDVGTNLYLGLRQAGTGGNAFFYLDGNHEMIFTTNTVDRFIISGAGNILIGGNSNPASASASIGIFNGTAPTGSVTNGVVLYSEDVAASAELKVRDEAGNITVLSPHHFEGIPMGKSEDMAWSYYSERDGKYITVDMLKAIRTIEDLTRRVEKLEKELNMKSKKPVKLVYTGKVKAKKPVPINKQP